MTTEELKAHRLTICKALIEGKQCQCCYTPGSKVLLWQDASAGEAAQRLFSNRSPELVRIKPRDPRKCWVAWSDKGSFWVASTEMKKREVENDFPHITIRWQEVVEDVK